MNILLIEPDQLLAQACRYAFELEGHTVAHVVSAQAAVHQADERQPDVVVLELQLPRHNGVEFLYEFRSYSEWLHIPIIIYSFVPPNELQAAATLQKELGVQRVLHKQNTSLRQLCRAVRNVLPVVS
jgi:DNA-binding response OmpR family regulator